MIFKTVFLILLVSSFNLLATKADTRPESVGILSFFQDIPTKKAELFLQNPPGDLMVPFLKRIANINTELERTSISDTILTLQLLTFLKDSVLNGNNNISPEISAWRDMGLEEIRESAQNLLQDHKRLKSFEHQWLKKNRLVGFSNSLSKHTTSHGVDMQAMIKLIPDGPLPLYDTSRRGKLERNRHAPEDNALVRYSNWGAILAKALEVPVSEMWQSRKLQPNQTLSEIFSANSNKIGLCTITNDLDAEFNEAFRKLYWVYILESFGEHKLAFESLFGWLEDLSSGARRARKFISLIPDGHRRLITFQNTLAVPFFILDFQDGYWFQVQDRYESLKQKEFGSGEFYSEAMSFLLKTVEPALAALHMSVYGLGKNARERWRGGYAQHTLNAIQYATYALPQAWLHSRVLSQKITTNEFAPAIPFILTAALYKGYLGAKAASAVTVIAPNILFYLLFEGLASSVIGAAIGDSHFSLASSGVEKTKALFGYSFSGEQQEL